MRTAFAALVVLGLIGCGSQDSDLSKTKDEILSLQENLAKLAKENESLKNTLTLVSDSVAQKEQIHNRSLADIRRDIGLLKQTYKTYQDFASIVNDKYEANELMISKIESTLGRLELENKKIFEKANKTSEELTKLKTRIR